MARIQVREIKISVLMASQSLWHRKMEQQTVLSIVKDPVVDLFLTVMKRVAVY